MVTLAGDVVHAIRSHLATSVQGKHVDVAMSADDARSPCGSFRYKLYCVSCSLCQKKQGWRGTAVYTASSNILKIVGLPFDTHGEFDRVYGKRKKALNSQHQGTIRRWLAVNRYRIAPLMMELTRCFQESCPEEARVRYYVKNLFKRHIEFKQEKAKRYQWTQVEFELLLRRLLRLESSTADCNDLVVVQAFVEKDFFVSFVHPRLFRFLARIKRFCFPRVPELVLFQNVSSALGFLTVSAKRIAVVQHCIYPLYIASSYRHAFGSRSLTRKPLRRYGLHRRTGSLTDFRPKRVRARSAALLII